MQSPSDPITAVCIVADANKCPPGFELLLRSSDRKDDCDLWKDGVFKSRVTRYLCFSRTSSTTSSGPFKDILADILIQNDREIPPPGYILIERTVDTSEKATNKKQISVKMAPIAMTTDAICEIILLSKSKRAPIGYTSAGDMNGLLLCFKMSKVTTTASTHNMSSSNTTTTYAQNGQRRPAIPHSSSEVIKTSHGINSAGDHHQQQILSQNPLSGVPFRLNPKFADNSTVASLQNVPILTYKSHADIENEFSYVFNLESTIASQS